MNIRELFITCLFEEDSPCLGWGGGGGGFRRHHLSQEPLPTILLAVKFELTEKYSASKS